MNRVKTGFDKYFDERMKDPEFAAEYKKAYDEINEPVMIGVTKDGNGYGIWRVPNTVIGGFDYVSDECYQVVIDSMNAEIETLEIILADLKRLRKT